MKNNQLNNQNKVCNYIICFDKKHMNTGFQIQISTIVKKNTQRSSKLPQQSSKKNQSLTVLAKLEQNESVKRGLFYLGGPI